MNLIPAGGFKTSPESTKKIKNLNIMFEFLKNFGTIVVLIF